MSKATPARKFFQGKNFMTPDVLGYGKLHPRIAYELSSGTGFRNDPICGISIRYEDANGEFKDVGLSQLRSGATYNEALRHAEQYLDELQTMFKGLKRNMGNREKAVMENLTKIEEAEGYLDCWLFVAEPEADGHSDTFIVDLEGEVRN